VVVFRSLAREQLRRILDLGLQQVQRRVDEGLSTPFRIIVTEMAAEFLLKEGVDTRS
jgi:ATP-dependent Clp protease ATP-binding subunit ClpA